MAKMDDDDLLEILQRQEESAAHYIHGQLGSEREQLQREYLRQPYGTESEGWSEIVASDISDSVGWILPALLKTFSSTDKAVEFEPSRASDVKGAQQATDSCNYVFYKQNNGFLILHNALQDGLILRNSATHWRKEKIETVSSVPFKGASQEMIALLMQDYEDAEVQEVNPAPVIDPKTGQPAVDMMTGQPVMGYTGRLKVTEQKTVIKVESFEPENLLVARDWTSPLLADCPYVARLMRVTLSDLKQMGYDCTADDLRSSDTIQAQQRLASIGQADQSTYQDDVTDRDSDDDAMAEGILRIEFVLADVDGDGIAERLCVHRLQNKILNQETCSHVPIATFSPMLNSHRWDGRSMADEVSDLQKLHTEILRQTLDNLKLANNPRKNVLTDANWSPMANIDDLLDSRVGGIVRVKSLEAVTDNIIPFTAGNSLPVLEYVQGMRENRTGVSRTSMGLNPDSLNSTATGRQLDQSASMQRIELIARIAAETLLKPIFLGILKLLTDGDMEKLAFRMRDEFVEYDPNEWRDQYDMTINVGLGTGDAQQKATQLMAIMQLQKEGMALNMVTPSHLYHTASKLIENAGFKDVQNFVQDPKDAQPKPAQPPIEVQIEQMRIQADGQKQQAQSQNEVMKFQAETTMKQQLEQMKADAKLQETRSNLELQAANDARDSDREVMKAQMDAQLAQQQLEFDKWQTEFEAQTKIYIEEMKVRGAPASDVVQHKDDMLQVLGGLQAVIQQMSAPKVIVRDQSGRAVGVQHVNQA